MRDKDLVDLKEIKYFDISLEYIKSILMEIEKSLEHYIDKYPSTAKRIVQITRKALHGLEINGLPMIMSENDLLCLKNKLKIEGKFLYYDVKKKVIFLTYFGWFYYFTSFIFYWAAATVIGLFYILKKGDQESVSIVLGLTDEQYLKNDSPREFEKFCLNGPVSELRKSKFYVCSGQSIRSQEKFHYCRYPHFGVIEKCETSIFDAFSFVGFQLKYFLEFLLSSFSKPLTLLLGLDYAEFGAINFLNSKKFIDNYFLTQSSMYNQKLWLTDLPNKKFKAIMLWYSTNSKSVLSFISKHYNMWPEIFFLRADIHYVWNHLEKKWLENYIPYGEVRTCGPVLFYNDTFKSIKSFSSNQPDISISVFDIVPRKDDFALFYTFNYWKAFLDGVLESCKEIEKATNKKIKAFLKPKREMTHFSLSPEYIPYIESKKHDLVLLPTESSIYELCDISNVVVTIPFSSPAVLCHERKENSTYYDPSGVFVRPEPRLGVPICFSKEELKQFIYKKIG